MIAPLHLDELVWELNSVIDPSETIPNFRVGPFKPWEDMYYGDKKLPTFAEIVKMEGTDVAYRDKFSQIISERKPVTLIGLRLDNQIIIVEGMHRATSIALAASRGVTWDSTVQLFLADSNVAQLDMID